jgi:hypothetical protein
MDLKCIFHNRCIYRVPILVVLFSISSRNNRVKINRKKLKPFHYFSNKNNVHQIRKKRQYLVTKYSNRRLSAQTSTHTERLEVVSWRSGGQSVDRENIKKLHQIQKQSQQLVTKYLTKRCERKETASQVGSLASGRQAKCQYSEAQLLRAEVTNIWSRYTVAYSLQGYVQDKFWTPSCSSTSDSLRTTSFSSRLSLPQPSLQTLKLLILLAPSLRLTRCHWSSGPAALEFLWE